MYTVTLSTHNFIDQTINDVLLVDVLVELY